MIFFPLLFDVHKKKYIREKHGTSEGINLDYLVNVTNVLIQAAIINSYHRIFSCKKGEVTSSCKTEKDRDPRKKEE